MEDLKSELFNFCSDHILTRLAVIKERMASLMESLHSETKSSAGDKHETGRAMLQLEREKLGKQLREAESTQNLLNNVVLKESSDIIGLGSLVQTSSGTYFIAISAGEYVKNTANIFCISPATPIGQLLIGGSVGKKFVFNGRTTEILKII